MPAKSCIGRATPRSFNEGSFMMISFKKDGVENLRGVAQKQFAHHQTARETDARGERSLTAPTHGPSAFGQCQQPLQAEAVCKRFRRIRTLSTHVMGRAMGLKVHRVDVHMSKGFFSHCRPR